MKKFVAAIFLLFVSFINTYAQDAAFALKKDEVSNDTYYEEVVELPNVTQADIYKRAKNWVIANFKTADNNQNFDEKEMSIINAAALSIDAKKTMGWAVYEGTFDFKFHVWSKDGKYKFRIDNISYNMFYASYPDGKKTKNGTYSDISDNKIGTYLKGNAEEKFAGVVAAFKKGMTAEPKQSKNW